MIIDKGKNFEIIKEYSNGLKEEIFDKITEYNIFCVQINTFLDEQKHNNIDDDSFTDSVIGSELLNLDMLIFEEQVKNKNITPNEYNYMINGYSKENKDKTYGVIVNKLHDILNNIFDLLKRYIETLDQKINQSEIYGDKFKLNIDKIIGGLDTNSDKNNSFEINGKIMIKKISDFFDDYKVIKNNIEKSFVLNIENHNKGIKNKKNLDKLVVLSNISFSKIEDNILIEDFIEKIEFDNIEDLINISNNYNEKIQIEQNKLGIIYKNNSTDYIEKTMNSRLEIQIEIYRNNLINVIENIVSKIEKSDLQEYKKYLIPQLLEHKNKLNKKINNYEFLTYNLPNLRAINNTLKTIQKNEFNQKNADNIDDINKLLTEINSGEILNPKEEDFEKLAKIMESGNNSFLNTTLNNQRRYG